MHGRVSNDAFGAIFTRLLYYSTCQLHLTPDEFWLTPFGLFMDLSEYRRQFIGISKPKLELTADDVIPYEI